MHLNGIFFPANSCDYKLKNQYKKKCALFFSPISFCLCLCIGSFAGCRSFSSDFDCVRLPLLRNADNLSYIYLFWLFLFSSCKFSLTVNRVNF